MAVGQVAYAQLDEAELDSLDLDKMLTLVHEMAVVLPIVEKEAAGREVSTGRGHGNRGSSERKWRSTGGGGGSGPRVDGAQPPRGWEPRGDGSSAAEPTHHLLLLRPTGTHHQGMQERTLYCQGPRHPSLQRRPRHKKSSKLRHPRHPAR
ncbi:unnamed protein product [Lampetra planeri]